MQDYQRDLAIWLADLPNLPKEIVSGTPVTKPYSQDFLSKINNPAFATEMANKYPTDPTFLKYTGTNHVTLLKNWAGGGIMTTCNGFVGQAGKVMGAKDFLGQFELKEFLTKSGKGYAYVDATSGRKPNYGDLFRSESFHMGVSLGFEGEEWLTAEAGQGGSLKGCDAIHRKRKKFVAASLKGWCDMRSYLSGKPMMPDWMVGTWVVYCGNETFHYSLTHYAEAFYYPYNPANLTLSPKMATDTGTVSLHGADGFTINWRGEVGIEKFKYERFDSFPGIMEKVSGFSDSNEPMRGVRL
jgi:hypothetical protein